MLYRNNIVGSVYYMGGVPMVFEEFCFSMIQMIQFHYEYLLKPNEKIFYDRPKGSTLHDAARNYIAANFKGDWVFMLDCDHAFEPDILVRLLAVMENTKTPVVGAVYVQKAPPFYPTIWELDEENRAGHVVSWEDNAALISSPKLCLGAGSLLIRREVFDRIENELHEHPFDRIPGLGEDFSFFARLKKLGIQSKTALFIESFHLAITPLGLADYNKPPFKLEGVTP